MTVHRKLVRAYTAVFVLALASPAVAHEAAAMPADITSIRIDNFGRVDAAYYRGSQPKGRDYADLAALGVKTLINLTGDDADPQEAALARQSGLRYFQIAMTTHVVPTAAQVAEFLKIVNDPANQPVYVHCVGGRHRTGVMTAVYRLTHDGWTAERAFTEMKQYKFGADFLHPEFKQFVFSYAMDLVRAAAPVASKAGSSSR